MIIQNMVKTTKNPNFAEIFLLDNTDVRWSSVIPKAFKLVSTFIVFILRWSHTL